MLDNSAIRCYTLYIKILIKGRFYYTKMNDDIKRDEQGVINNEEPQQKLDEQIIDLLRDKTLWEEGAVMDTATATEGMSDEEKCLYYKCRAMGSKMREEGWTFEQMAEWILSELPAMIESIKNKK